MPHASLSHPQRGNLTFQQPQSDEDSRQASGNVTPQLGTPELPLVHVETRDRSRQIRGRVTAPGRARDSPDTDEWRQALADYVDRLESHVSEFQGEGYEFEDSIRGESVNAIYHSVDWTLMQGAPYEFEFDAELAVGRGTMDSRPLQRRNPSVSDGMDVAARVDGNDLPGLRRMQVSRSFAVDVKAIYGRESAENNDVIPQEGVVQEVVFEGTHTGSDSERAAVDSELEALIGSRETVEFETAFPGYTLEGFVMGYDSNLEARFGTGSHQYRLRFVEGQRA